ncbi:MAG: hypothetical protein JXO51_01555 [Candidatus Aminicenantes bacterium]|nr:hypothetical protein [Candidatus Aminicenantes bacterium]
MKKRMWLGFAMLAAVLFLASCEQVEYEAYVTIVNIGNMPMTAWVDGDGADIPAYDSLTWSVPLESEDEVVQLLLEAEPAGGGDSDEIVVLLHGDRDIVTWLTGWDLAQNTGPQKKESQLLHGPAPQ